MKLTKEQYAIAERNGISPNLFYQRVNKLGWDIETALTKKTREVPGYGAWKQKASENGISYTSFRQRLKRGMTLEDAATIPPGTKINFRPESEYAIYKGEEFMFMGTAKECAAHLRIKIESFLFCLTSSHQKRVAKQKDNGNRRVIVKLDDDDDE